MVLAGVDVPVRTQVRRERAALDAVLAAEAVLRRAVDAVRFADLASDEATEALKTAAELVSQVSSHLREVTP